jgi:hypothetical protein
MKHLAFLLVFLLATPAAAGQPDVPVRIGDVPDLDACMSEGVVNRPHATTIALRSGPGDSFRLIQHLRNGQEMHLCSPSKDGLWSGVVLAMDGVLDCGVSSPVPRPVAYRGPCISGWVRSKWVKVTAG